jgi:hypothetical protein
MKFTWNKCVGQTGNNNSYDVSYLPWLFFVWNVDGFSDLSKL